MKLQFWGFSRFYIRRQYYNISDITGTSHLSYQLKFQAVKQKIIDAITEHIKLVKSVQSMRKFNYINEKTGFIETSDTI